MRGSPPGVDLQVDAVVLQVAHRPRGARQVADVVQRESEVRRQVGGDSLRQRPAGVLDGGEQLARLSLELRKVVVLGAHLLPQFGVRPAGLFRSRGALTVQPVQLGVQRDDGLDRLVAEPLAHVQRGEPQRVEQRSALRPLEFDLQLRPLGQRIRGEQLLQRHPERLGHRAQIAQARLALSVLEHADLGGGATDRGADVIQRHSAVLAKLTDASAERE